MFSDGELCPEVGSENGQAGLNKTVALSTEALADLEAAGIDSAFHAVLLSANLDLETLQVFAGRDKLYLDCMLEKAGVTRLGDRVKVLKALTLHDGSDN